MRCEATMVSHGTSQASGLIDKASNLERGTAAPVRGSQSCWIDCCSSESVRSVS